MATNKRNSESIGNQRNILQRYIRRTTILIKENMLMMVYLGLHFDRPGFNECYRTSRNKTINMVVTKDLSRLGRRLY